MVALNAEQNPSMGVAAFDSSLFNIFVELVAEKASSLGSLI